MPEVAALGPHIEVFKPAAANILAGFVFIFLFAVGAIGVSSFLLFRVIKANFNLPFYDEDQLAWLWVILLSLAPIGMLVGAATCTILVRNLLSFRLYCCPAGFYIIRHGEIQVFRWEEVSRITETVFRERIHLQHNLKLPAGASRSYLIERQDGHEETLDGNSIRRLVKFSQILRAEAEARGIPWKVEEKSK